ncbi:hypothetical protein GTP55_25860 [Duganella sp. FT109W]|uniref:SDR family NAD(P)-dependent oxidoreductase n=1 Tax=Duganella margarita TaxID=2692170 RepID=A0ABW9WNK6_9BURK|nr:hypothetical protein [Duganella margarita]
MKHRELRFAGSFAVRQRERPVRDTAAYHAPRFIAPCVFSPERKYHGIRKRPRGAGHRRHKGIGLAIAQQLAQQGITVLLAAAGVAHA